MTPAVTKIKRLCLLALVLTFCVVVLGAYVRLSDAGLGCPDWPGCYGHLKPPTAAAASSFDSQSPLVAHKAWKEMAHRYAAGTLGLLILFFFVVSILKPSWGIKRKQAGLLLAVVIFQALLGMWTVTLKLHPFVVMAHLLGGFTTLGLLFWMYLGESPISVMKHTRLWFLAMGAFIVLLIQIALGGWTSSNYAALACPDFPTCQGSWLPPMDLEQALHFWPNVGPDYTGGALDNSGRVTIHMLHRFGALTVFIVILFYATKLYRQGAIYRKAALILIMILLTQIALGISNVLLFLPLPLAAAHNGVAALLFLTMIYTLWLLKSHASLASAKRMAVFILAMLIFPLSTFATPSAEALKKLGVKEHVGEQVPLELEFFNESGNKVSLNKLLKSKKPVLLNLVYFECPSLCTLQLNGFIDSLKKMSWAPGGSFDIVTVSIDPKETSHLAAQKKVNALEKLGKPGSEKGWHFLVGEESNIKKLAESVGFGYVYDEETREYLHAAAIAVLSSEGRIVRYLHGVQFYPQDIKLALIEAGDGNVGNFMDRITARLYRYDPLTRHYVLFGPKEP